jgi:hypothetical protein
MKKRLQVKFMLVQSAPSDHSDSDSDGESVSDVLKGLTQQMESIDSMTKTLDSHILSLYERARVETVDWMKEPLKPRKHIQKWCSLHGLPARPTMDEFMDACLAAAWSVDLETRVVTFKKEDAATLWGGQRRITVFDMVRLVPTLFE